MYACVCVCVCVCVTRVSPGLDIQMSPPPPPPPKSTFIKVVSRRSHGQVECSTRIDQHRTHTASPVSPASMHPPVHQRGFGPSYQYIGLRETHNQSSVISLLLLISNPVSLYSASTNIHLHIRTFTHTCCCYARGGG